MTKCDHCSKPEDEENKMNLCSVCESATYCNVACQQWAWPSHKADCTKAGCLQLIAAVERDDGAAVSRLAKTKGVLNGQAAFTPPRTKETPDPPAIERWTALHECVIQSNVDMLKLLIDNGAELELRDEDGETPTFLLASRFKHSELLDVLLDAGANPNARAEDGWSCLMMAVRARDYETSKALLDAGANVYLGRDMVGRTALEIIAQQASGQAGTLVKVGESLDEALEQHKTLHALLLQYS
jgi:hypothetical protein